MRLSLLFTGLLFSMAANAQISITNAGFEEGTGTSAKGWTTENTVLRTSSYTTMVDGQTVTVQPKEGNYFLQLTTTVNGSDIRIGSASITLGNVGYPDSLTYNAVYFKKITDDNFIFNIEFLKYNASTHQSTVVMAQGASGFQATTTWKRSSSQFWYFGEHPDYDSLRITIMPTNPSQHDPDTGNPRFADGTTVLIDGLGLVSNATGIDNNTGKAEKISVYPNPAKDNFTISFSKPAAADRTLEIFDPQGKLVTSQVIARTDEKIQVSISDWKQGVYFYRVSSGISAEYGKLVVVP